jgi:tetratricopeptide (TPR) repeat protein
MRVTAILLLVSLGGTAPLAGQTYEEHIARGDSLTDLLEHHGALEEYRAAFMLNPSSYEAMWKFSGAQIDVARQLDDDEKKLRDSLYWVARIYAEAAVSTDSGGAEGHFMLSQSLGRLSRTRGGKERVRFGKEIYDNAAWAIRIDSLHDGAYHVLGAWHAEIKRLSGFTKFFAKTFLGGGYMDIASWDSAAANLEISVELKPEHIFHRLELARVYADMERWGEAAEQLEVIATLEPGLDIEDPRYKEEAAALLREIRARGGEGEDPSS